MTNDHHFSLPLEEEPLFVSDEVEEVRGSGPSGDARALEGKWLQSHQLQFPVPCHMKESGITVKVHPDSSSTALESIQHSAPTVNSFM